MQHANHETRGIWFSDDLSYIQEQLGTNVPERTWNP